MAAAAPEEVFELEIDSAEVERGLARVDAAFDHLGDRMAIAMEKGRAAFERQIAATSKAPPAIGLVAASYDTLRGKMDPVLAAQQRMEREMIASLGVINNAVRLGVTTEEQATRDIARLKAQQVEQINRVRDAQLGANAAANDNVISAGGLRFRRQNLMFQAQDIGVSLAGGMNPAMVLMQQGSQIAGAYSGNGGVNALLKDAGSLAGTLVTRLSPVAAVAGLGAMAIADMRAELEKSEGRAVSFGETFMAAMKIVASDIDDLFKPVVDAIAPGFDTAWDAVSAGAKYAGNEIINSFHAAYVDVQYVWNQFPNMMGTVVVGGLNLVVGGVEDMLNAVTDRMNAWIDALNARLTSIMGPGTKIEGFGRIDFGPDLPNPYAADLDKATELRNRRIAEIMGSNPLGDYYKSVRDRVGDALTDPAGQGSDKWGGLREVDRKRLDEMRDAARKIEDAFKGIEKVGMSAIDRIVDSATNGFRDIGDVMKSVANDIMKELLELAVKNPLKNAIFGAGLPTLDTVGGAGGFLGTLFGGRSRTGAVDASDAWSGMRGANDNLGAPVIPVTRGALPDVMGPAGLSILLGAGGRPNASGAYGSDLAGNIRALGSNIGANPRDIAAMMSYESGFNPNVWGGAGGKYYGLIQAGGPERAQYGIKPGGSLADQFGGIENFFKGRGFKPGMSGLDLYSTVNAGSPGRYNASDAANGGQWGTVRDKWEKQMGPHFEKADQLLGSFSDKTAEATQSLGGLDTGVSSAVKALTGSLGSFGGSGGPGIGGGGGMGRSWLFGPGGIFSGGGAADPWAGMRETGPMGGGGILDWLMNLFGLPGFASGGHTGPFGGIVHPNETVFSQADIRRNGGVAAVEAMRRGAANGNAPSVNFSSTVINNTSAKVDQREEDDGNGGRHIVYTISDEVTSAMNKPGTSLNRAMRERGAAPARKRR